MTPTSFDQIARLMPERDDLREVGSAFGAFFAHSCDSARVRAADDTHGFDGGLWAEFCDLGGPTATLPEPIGGGGALDHARVIGVECGRALAPLPYVDQVVALRLLAASGADMESAVDRRWTLCVSGPSTLTTPILGSAAVADAALVVRHGRVEIYEIAARDIRALPNLGGLPMARLTSAKPAAVLDLDAEAARGVRAERLLLTGSTLVGACAGTLAIVLEHVKTREQFGRSLGSFQALQHRLADRACDLAAAHLLVAGASAGDASVEQASIAFEAAARAAERGAVESLQMFGGYGYTLEYDAHLYLRFIKAAIVLARNGQLLADAEDVA